MAFRDGESHPGSGIGTIDHPTEHVLRMRSSVKSAVPTAESVTGPSHAGQDQTLLPLTILDLMILSAGCALSAWLLASVRDELFDPSLPLDRYYWLVLTAFAEYGPTVVAPVILGLQFVRGRRVWLLAGEVVWLVIALELLPFALFLALTDTRSDSFWGDYWEFYVAKWLLYVSPTLVILAAIIGAVWHFRAGRPRHWSHRFGLAVTLAQCVPSTIIVVDWFN